MIDVVTIGETMAVFDGNPGTKLRYANTFECHTGGAETNTAVALVRLGHTAGWISRLGKDEFGLRIRNQIRGEGVDVSKVEMCEDFPTGIFFRQRMSNGESQNFYYRKGSAASTMKPEQLDREYIRRAKWLFVSGITPAISEDAARTVKRAMEMAKEEGVLVAFDPNLRLKLWTLEQARQTIGELMPYVDLALPGIEEGELLYGVSHTDAIAERIQSCKVKNVIVKTGSRGCVGYFGTTKAEGNGFPVEHVVDAFGAGDGFAAGILAGMLEDLPHEKILQLGNAVGALTVMIKGNIEAYPSREAVEHYMNAKDQGEILR